MYFLSKIIVFFIILSVIAHICKYDINDLIAGSRYTSNSFVADGEDDQVRWARVPRPGSVPDLGTVAASPSVHIVVTAEPLPRGSSATTVHRLPRRSCHPVVFCRRSKPVLGLVHVHNGLEHCCPLSSKWNQGCHQLLSSRYQTPANGSCIRCIILKTLY